MPEAGTCVRSLVATLLPLYIDVRESQRTLVAAVRDARTRATSCGIPPLTFQVLPYERLHEGGPVYHPVPCSVFQTESMFSWRARCTFHKHECRVSLNAYASVLKVLANAPGTTVD